MIPAMKITHDSVGSVVLPGRGDTHVVERVRVDNGRLAIEVLSLGAHLAGVWFPDRDGGRESNLTRSLPSLDAYANPDINKGYGSTIGRYANRIAGAAFDLDGHRYNVIANEGPNQLHGGPDHFGFRPWSIEATDDGARCRLISPDGDQGFPGTVTVTVDYVVDGDALEIRYEATTDAPTVVNLTNHAYWNLAGSDDARSHVLQVVTDRVLMVDEASIPTTLVWVDDVPGFDLRQPVPLTERPNGFDHCFVGASLVPPVAEIRAVLADPASGRTMIVTTDQPGLQVYTATFAEPPYSAVCLEAQLLPDTPNRPDFGSAVLRPGQTYRQVTRHEFAAR